MRGHIVAVCPLSDYTVGHLIFNAYACVRKFNAGHEQEVRCFSKALLLCLANGALDTLRE